MIVGLGALTQDQLNGLAPVPVTDPVYGTTQMLYIDPASGTYLPLGESISPTGQYSCDTSNPASQCYNLPGSPAGWSGPSTPVPFIGGGGRFPASTSGETQQPPSNVLTAPLPPSTPTPGQVTGGLTVQDSPVLVPASAVGPGFTMPTILTEASIGGIPNWMLIAGAAVALMLLKK